MKDFERSCAYSLDNDLNCWGDYDTLEVKGIAATRTLSYRLRSSKNPALVKGITYADFQQCCVNLFYMNAKPKPEETDPKPITAPWPGDPPPLTPPDSTPDTEIPLVR